MTLLDRLIPGRVKSNLRQSIEELKQVALGEARRQAMRRDTSVIWDVVSVSSAEVLQQLLVQNSDKQLDWGLKRRRHRFSQPRLAALYWWLLLYHMVLFKHRGADGFSQEAIFPELRQAAQQFIRYLADSPEFEVVVPEPWEDRWETQFSVEAALGIYNRVVEMLGLRMDLDKRVFQVSHFTTATERTYDSIVREKVQGQSSKPDR